MKRPFPRRYETIIEHRTPKSVPTIAVIYDGHVLLKTPLAGIEQFVKKWEQSITDLEAKKTQG